MPKLAPIELSQIEENNLRRDLSVLVESGIVERNEFINSLLTRRLSGVMRAWLQKVVRDNTTKAAFPGPYAPLQAFLQTGIDNMIAEELTPKRATKMVLPGNVKIQFYHHANGVTYVNQGYNTPNMATIQNGYLEIFDEIHGPAIAALLIAFQNNPAEIASAYGKLMKHCCFCSRDLSDDRSIFAGYGETCAGHRGLPWGALGE